MFNSSPRHLYQDQREKETNKSAVEILRFYSILYQQKRTNNETSEQQDFQKLSEIRLERHLDDAIVWKLVMVEVNTIFKIASSVENP